MITKQSREFSSRLLTVLFALVVPLASLTAWAITSVTNTDSYVATLHPLATNPIVQTYVANEGASILIRDLHVRDRVTHALPPSASFLASTITNELQVTIAGAIHDALATQGFATLWDRENRFTHGTAVSLLQGKGNLSIDKARQLVVNVTPTLISAIAALHRQGITLLDPLQASLVHDQRLTLQLLNSQQLRQTQFYFRTATQVLWLLPLITLLLAIAAIRTARSRTVGTRRLSLALVGSATLAFGFLQIAITSATTLAPTPTDVTSAILRTLTKDLRGDFESLILVGLLSLIGHWISGSSQRASDLRQHFAHSVTILRVALQRQTSLARSTDWVAWTRVRHEQISLVLVMGDWIALTACVVLVLSSVRSLPSLLLVVLFAIGWIQLTRAVHRALRPHNVTEIESAP